MSVNNADEDRELLMIEDLSQKLEEVYRKMEEIRRENLLFESYILRNEKEFAGKRDDPEQQKRYRRKGDKIDQGQEIKLLTPEMKYEIANAESEALKKNIDEGRIKSDSILETLRAILEETDMAITEIRKDAFDFQREILIGGENSRTGKIEAEKIVKYRDEKLRQKEALIEKYKAKKATLETQIVKTENQIRKKEEMGDDLKFIDFHQLQIENKKYVKEIDEKNDNLLSLKISTGKITNKLTGEKNGLQRKVKNGDEIRAENTEKRKNIENANKEMKKVEDEIYMIQKKNRELDAAKKQIENMPDTIRYVDMKAKADKLSYEIKNERRKIEINNITFHKAKKILGVTDFKEFQCSPDDARLLF